MPGVVTAVVCTFIGAWNEYVVALFVFVERHLVAGLTAGGAPG